MRPMNSADANLSTQHWFPPRADSSKWIGREGALRGPLRRALRQATKLNARNVGLTRFVPPALTQFDAASARTAWTRNSKRGRVKLRPLWTALNYPLFHQPPLPYRHRA